jgi:hypothetical protein
MLTASSTRRDLLRRAGLPRVRGRSPVETNSSFDTTDEGLAATTATWFFHGITIAVHGRAVRRCRPTS